MRNTLPRAATLLVALALAVGATERVAEAQPSAGDIAEARELYNEGLRLRDNGDLAGAAEKLRGAYALASTPITGLGLAQTYVAIGKLVEARETLLAVARLPVAPLETAHAKEARADAAQLAERLRPRIPSLVIKIHGIPGDSVAVEIDGASVPTEALLAPRMVNPGTHDLVATSTAGGKAMTKVDVKEGEARTVEITMTFAGGSPSQPATEVPVPTGTPVAPATTRSSSSSTIRPVLLFGGFGLAAAGVVAGSLTGAMAMSKSSSVKNACEGLTCPTSVNGNLSSGRTLGNVSTVAFIAAGVGAAVGVVGLVLHPHTESATTAWLTPWVGPGGAGLSGALRF